jgi:hypothetical protein
MGGFLSLYDLTERVDMGGGYYVDIRRHVSTADTARAEAVHIDKRIESTVSGAEQKGGTEVRSVATRIDQQAHDLEILAVYIDSWNLTDRAGNPLPLPPFIPPKPTGEDPANRVRRETILLLPVFAKKRILEKIKEFEDRGADDPEAFPDEGESTPSAS